MNEVRTVLLATDFSETSLAAFDAARGVAERYGARIVVVHVDECSSVPLLVDYTAVAPAALHKQQLDQAGRQLERLAGDRLSGLEVERVVAQGVAHLEIVRLADERSADLIVMATHGRGFISHALMGSTTERVLRRANCPVLVVRR
jgi:nucleotide-binding universal stress UspA family protein